MTCPEPVSLYSYWSLWGKGYVGARWLLTRTRAGRVEPVRERGLHPLGAPGIEYPDIQFHFLPIAVRYDGRAALKGHGFQIHVGPMRSPSRGAGLAALGRSGGRRRGSCFNYMSDP